MHHPSKIETRGHLGVSDIYQGIVARTVSVWRTERKCEVIDREPLAQRAVDPRVSIELSAEELGVTPGTTCLVEFRTAEDRLVYQRYVTAT